MPETQQTLLPKDGCDEGKWAWCPHPAGRLVYWNLHLALDELYRGEKDRREGARYCTAEDEGVDRKGLYILVEGCLHGILRDAVLGVDR